MSQEYFLPLYTAVISQDITLVTEIISSTPSADRLEMVNSRDSSNSTPLHLAISTGNASMLELLLENGADT
jgi:ankyrin repeat protein